MLPPTTFQPGTKIWEIFSIAAHDQFETNLKELFNLLNLPTEKGDLEKVEIINQVVESSGFSFVPDLNKGGLESARCIRLKTKIAFTAENIIDEISKGESYQLECKTSLLYDHKKAKFHPGLEAKEYKSDEILHSSLKTIAAFLNTKGGILYIGFDNEQNAIGLTYDYCFFKNEHRNTDFWEQNLSNHVHSKFIDGNAINDYVLVDFMIIKEKTISRIKVYRRKTLSFLKYKDEYKLYKRQGNKTVEVKIHEMGEFMKYRESL